MTIIFTLVLLVFLYFWFCWLFGVGKDKHPVDIKTTLLICAFSLILFTFNYWADYVSSLPGGIDLIVVLGLLFTGLYGLIYLIYVVIYFLAYITRSFFIII
jgi:hypothetical protein